MFGWVSDRYGRRAVFFVTAFIQFITSLATTFSPDYYMFLLLRLPIGICSGGKLLPSINHHSEPWWLAKAPLCHHNYQPTTTITQKTLLIFIRTKTIISSLYVCMVNVKLKYNFVETSRKFIIAKLSIRKIGSTWVLIIASCMKQLTMAYLYGSIKRFRELYGSILIGNGDGRCERTKLGKRFTAERIWNWYRIASFAWLSSSRMEIL